jgi:spermidine synthase
MPTYYSLFASTVFLSSFLLFQVQPLIGKHILPWYGGSSAVWVTALLFFMVALALGYVYALWLSRYKILTQAILHLLFIILVVVQTIYHAKFWPSGITPNLESLATISDPTWSVFVTLAVAIGLPFVLLSSTSSLLQLWYNRLSGQEPFALYSISNIGSLLGLLSYPVLFEPLLATYAQGDWWTFGLALYLGLLCSIIFTLIYDDCSASVKAGKTIPVNVIEEGVGYRKFFIWTGLASIPVAVLLAGTTFMTTAIAPIPLLWVGPLALYLGSFIWTFRERTQPLKLEFNEGIVIVLGLGALVLSSFGVMPVFVTITVIHLALFSIFHWCHEYLYSIKPEAKNLTVFYVALSIGGVVGSLLIKISSLYLLVLPIELSIILSGSVVFILYRWYKSVPDFLPPKLKKHAAKYAMALATLTCLVGVNQVYNFEHNSQGQARNFFGYKAIINYERNGVMVQSMQHGMTNHGFQVMRDGVLQIETSSYYGTTSGMGKAISYLRSSREEGISVAVIGLGAGSLAAYCREGDQFTFMEIDPQVISLTRKYFTYLESCPSAKVITGDGRLTMQKIKETNPDTRYDIIVLDAYADDMIPVHLMTKEAFALYKELLTADGVIAIHISSRYLNLLPVTAFLAEENTFAARHWFDRKPQSPTYVPSHWVLLAQSEEVFAGTEFSETNTFSDYKERVKWTDTYSAILPVIKHW